jgi:hypothetical protein
MFAQGQQKTGVFSPLPHIFAEFRVPLDLDLLDLLLWNSFACGAVTVGPQAPVGVHH